jgi:hypothetical protein
MANFLNGLTKQYEAGTPPSDWRQAIDGFWYPSSVPITEVDPNLASGVVDIVRLVGVDVPILINIEVLPAAMAYGTARVPIEVTVSMVPLPLPLSTVVTQAVRALLDGKVENYFDEDRAGKTLLNFGDDYQALITNWQYPTDGTQQNIVAKLYEPLPAEVDLKTQLWISRELSPSVLDRLFFEFIPQDVGNVFLRPPNRNVGLTGRTGASVENATLRSLFSTGSLNVVKPTDPVLEEWYTHDFNNSNLNIDFSDYRNFVFFGSAQARLQAFVQKLHNLEDINSLLSKNSASLAGTGSAFITGTLAYPAISKLSDSRVETLRSFDAYERFLYYSSAVPYSASLHLTEDAQDAFYYNSDATWPKISGSVVPVASASAWITVQSSIAADYDRQNPNFLGNNIPLYLQSDTDSAEFRQFLNLIGHQMDTLKVYIDQMTNIYDRSSDASVGMSPDIVWNVAQSLGIELPNQYAIKTLVDYTIGQTSTVSEKVYYEIASETWKRFLHNQIFLMKSKGTKQSLRALANTYGILPTTLQIRESATPGNAAITGSFEAYEEQTNVLAIPTSAYLQLPWRSLSGSLIPQTVEIRFATTNATQSVLAHADNKWALTIEPVTGSWATVALRDSGSISTQTAAISIFGGEYFTAALTFVSGGMQLRVKRAIEETIVDNELATEPTPKVSGVWTVPTNFYLGTSGSSFGQPFSGYLDEARIWSETLTTDIIDQHVKYPGLYNGNLTTSSRDALLMRLSFNKPKNLGGTAGTRFYVNESPMMRLPTAPIAAVSASASGFPNVTSYPYNMTVLNRSVVRYTPNSGGSQFTTNKVTVAAPAQLDYLAGTTVPVLRTDRSIVTPQTKLARGVPSNVVGFYFSLSDAINDSIIRSIGIIDLQNLIGDPADLNNSSYSSLTALNKLYWAYYAYNYNPNTFVDFVRNLLDPLFRQAKELIPARAKLLSGIVHEPHILERAKLAHPPMQVSAGSLTRNATEPNNLESHIATTHSIQLHSVRATYDTKYTMSSSTSAHAVPVMYDARVTPSSSLHPLAVVSTQDSRIPLTRSISLRSTVSTFDDTSNLAAYQNDVLNRFGVTSLAQLSTSQLGSYADILSRFRSKNSVNIWQVLQNSSTAMDSLPAELSIVVPILPYTNFDNVESYTYFTDPSGSFGLDAFVLVRSNQNVLTSRGTWTPGQTYQRDNYVIQSGSNGDAAFGNGNEFVCTTTDSSFVSYIDPYLDTRNWTAMTYTPVKVIDKRQAVLINGTVTLAVTGSGYPPVIGYRPQHYKFRRDTRLGTRRHLWLGCVQTDSTTLDGKPAVEITVGAGEKLFVHNASDPVQPSNNSSGPILDVQ